MQIADKLRRLDELRQTGCLNREFAEQVRAQLLTEAAVTPESAISEHLRARAFEIMSQNDGTLPTAESSQPMEDYLGVCQLRRSDADGLSRVESILDLLHTLCASRNSGSCTLEIYYLLESTCQPGSDFWVKYLTALDRLRGELGEPVYEGIGPWLGYDGPRPDLEQFEGEGDLLVGWMQAIRIAWWQHDEQLLALVVTAHDASSVFALTLVRLVRQ